MDSDSFLAHCRFSDIPLMCMSMYGRSSVFTQYFVASFVLMMFSCDFVSRMKLTYACLSVLCSYIFLPLFLFSVSFMFPLVLVLVLSVWFQFWASLSLFFVHCSLFFLLLMWPSIFNVSYDILLSLTSVLVVV